MVEGIRWEGVDMERLTERTERGIVGNNDKVTYYPLYKVALGDPLDHGIIGQCFEKLADYEDAEEQGLLLRLMCDAGDKVYYPYFIDYRVIDLEIVEIRIYEDEIIYIDDVDNVWYEYDLGKTIFLTKEEAEKKLAEMKGEEV